MLGACDTGEPRQAGPGRRSGADLSASGPQVAKAEARVRDTTVWSVRRANLSASTLIPAHTGSSGRPLVPMVGPPRWAVDSAGGTNGQLTHPGLGSFEERYQVACFSQVLVWSERSGGAPASASVLMTATDGPQARLKIERHPALGSAGQHVSVDVSVLLHWVPFSPSPSTLP